MLRLLLEILRINWLNYRPADCLPNHCFCEAIGTGLIRQPINAYTNIAYILAGLIIIIFLSRTKNKRKTISPITELPRRLLILFGLASIAVGIGSFIYHASFIFLGEQLDDDSMYLIGSFMLFYAIAHQRKLTAVKFIMLFMVLNLIFEGLIFFFPVIRGMLFGILIVVSLVITQTSIRRGLISDPKQQFMTSIELFAAAYLIWILDKTHYLCYPTSIFQGHAIWHILSAVAGLMMFFFMDADYERDSAGKHTR
ncbi:MAG: ceramidase domain-containing protein [Anaerolineaceae bacterium]